MGMGEAKHKHKLTKLAPDQFWKLRALLRDVEQTQAQARAAVDASAQKAQDYLVSLGLRVGVNYELVDETCSVRLAPRVIPGT